MTLKEIGEYVECYQRQEKENLKQIAFVQYQIAEKLIAGLNMSKPQAINFDKLFPSLYDKPKEIKFSELTAEQERNAWLIALDRADLIE